MSQIWLSPGFELHSFASFVQLCDRLIPVFPKVASDNYFCRVIKSFATAFGFRKNILKTQYQIKLATLYQGLLDLNQVQLKGYLLRSCSVEESWIFSWKTTD
jgi:hypothetical protein